MVLVTELIDELIGRISSLPQFTNKSFSIYNVEEMEKLSMIGFPLVGVAYEGGSPVDNTVSPVARGSHSAALYRANFTVILAVEYQSAVAVDDTKVSALDLMDSIRAALFGYQGVNSRPWVFESETPIDGGLEGVIFYGQLWRTDIAVIGNSTHP
jgi:hypothetical protein